MEQFFQYTGHDSDAQRDALLLDREKRYVYSSPRERALDRGGELPRGAYFACSDLVFYENQVWMKIRRGAFSNAAQSSGYLKVEFDFDEQLAPKQRRCTAFHGTPRRFKQLVQLPSFPAFLCSRVRLPLSSALHFHAVSTSLSSPSRSGGRTGAIATSLTHQPRQLPPASVFQATESRFSDDFSRLALQITSPFGLTGWICVSFGDALESVDDPRLEIPSRGTVLVQNVAPRTGKWMGELPVRGSPSLQAPRRGNLESFRIATAVERKLVKDHVWLRLQDFEGAQENDDRQRDQKEQEEEDEEAWIIERHANTAERVVVPWGADEFHDETLHRDPYTERYYRNIYGRRVLPLRKAPRLEAEVVGELAPGTVVVSTRRVLNERGNVWVRIALSAALSGSTTATSASTTSSQELTYGYAIQSSAKTNVCMLQEISAPGKMAPKQFFQVVLRSAASPVVASTGSTNPSGVARGSGKNDATPRVAARSEPSRTAKELFTIKDGAVVSAIGSIYNSSQRTMWLQVLRADLDPEMLEKTLHEPAAAHTSTHSSNNQENEDNDDDQFVVYVPVCSTEPGREHECVLFSLGRALHKAEDPAQQDAKRQRTGGARVVFTGGRASKLFGGSQLMAPSTINLDSHAKTPAERPAARAAGGDDTRLGTMDPAQSLKDEIDAWQRASSATTSVLSQAKSALFSCVQRPFASCLQRQSATQMYAQLHNQDDGDDDDE